MKLRKTFKYVLINAAVIVLLPYAVWGQRVITAENKLGSKKTIFLSNDQIEFNILFDNDTFISDKINSKREWTERNYASPAMVETDGNFSFDIMYTDWRPSDKGNNADNAIKMSKKDFQFIRYDIVDGGGGARQINIYFKAYTAPFKIRLSYKLSPNDFCVRKKIAVCDSVQGSHFLQYVAPVDAGVFGSLTNVKAGGFGQPVVFEVGQGGAFFGLEYPTSENSTRQEKGNTLIQCRQEIGSKIEAPWIESDWAVIGLTPNSYVKYWFMKYVESIRVAPVKPYTLYNSWYDLRAADYPSKTPTPENVAMNEKNILRIIDLIRKNMIEKNNIKLDAFVLDDGWDAYKSDWVLRKEQFPNGIKPIVDELKKTGTELGMWFGPTGGYSARMDRINWMKDHGYEVVGKGKDYAMLCLAGRNYSSIFDKRVTDFTKEGVGYFKWDGIQFSCSEPDHGHAVGVYSRRAVMESVIEKCNAVRALNPNMYLNITSGTWLSPWWVKYANQIWMDGEDYGYADVPSISARDAAITYRDFVLYDDFKTKDLWFPVANLMAGGIIKGNLEKLGGENEPLDKFTTEAVLYFARGVSMYELYISPDLLTDAEWTAMSKAISWAKDRFPLLSQGEMVGGDPRKRETYGYVHFNGSKGIVAARNPYIIPNKFKVDLNPAYGLDTKAVQLVVERVFPDRWISPKLYKAGDLLDISLEGYETAIYEIYPLADAEIPLIGGVTFDTYTKGGNLWMNLYKSSPDVKLLNPEAAKSISLSGRKILTTDIEKEIVALKQNELNYQIKAEANVPNSGLKFQFTLPAESQNTHVAVLLQPSEETGVTKEKPSIAVTINEKEAAVKLENKDELVSWFTVKAEKGESRFNIKITLPQSLKSWRGKAIVWLIDEYKQNSNQITFELNKPAVEKVMPPKPFAEGNTQHNVKIGEFDVTRN
jgi:hypothetical protein